MIKEKALIHNDKTDLKRESYNEALRHNLPKEKGASCWLNAMSLKINHFDLTKSELRDGIDLRYGWEPTKMPATCACCQPYSISCPSPCKRAVRTLDTML